MLIHLDTDIGGDVDDLCALAMLLRWPGAELVGVTTACEADGRRAGYVRRALELAGRQDVPVAAGVDVTTSGRFPFAPGYPPDDRYWGGPVPAAPGPAEAALALLEASVERGAAILAVGPWTNLAELEARDPGILASARVVAMGGCLRPPRAGFPPWGGDKDYNVYMDPAAAATVLAKASPTVVPIEVTVETAVRRAWLPALRAAGPLGGLVARQVEAQGEDERNAERWGRPYAGLPDDLLAFLHDPLACAVALGWDQGVRIERLPLAWGERDGRFREWVEDGGRVTEVVTQVDGPAFGEEWLRVVAGG